jgi:single-strand DNA-binding protein
MLIASIFALQRMSAGAESRIRRVTASQNAPEKQPQFHIKNKVTLIGVLGNYAEVRADNDHSFTTFSLATKSSYKKDDKYISHTEWHRCIVFGKPSEFARTFTKGAHIQVEGELRCREYDSEKTNTKERVWEVRVASIVNLDRAEKATPEDQEKDQEHDDVAPRGHGLISRCSSLSEAQLSARLSSL